MQAFIALSVLSFLVTNTTQTGHEDGRNNIHESTLKIPVAEKRCLPKLLRTLDFHGSMLQPPGSVVFWDFFSGLTDPGVVKYYVFLILLSSM